jgi:DNA repair exonuclease SbcCD ATPase subunit
MARFEVALETAQRRLADTRDEGNPHELPWQEARKRCNKLITARATEAGEGDKARDLIGHYTAWEKGFRHLRLQVIDEVLTTLSLWTSAYAEAMGLDVEVKFETERETKTGSVVRGITCVVDGVNKLDQWSGGEGQRLRLAASLALSALLLAEANVECPTLILDEPSAHLSPEGLKELTGFLKELGERDGIAIWLTDQRPISEATSTMTVTREAEGIRVA